MVQTDTINKKIKNLLSAFYRLLLIIYGLLIICIQKDIFNWTNYLIAFFTYLLAYSVLYNKNSWYSKIRQLNDYAFITIILWGKNIDVFTYPFLLIPIFNSPNSTGHSRDFTRYALTTICLAVLLRDDFKLLYLIPLLFIFLIDLVDYARAHMTKYNSDLYDAIDSFYLKKVYIKKSHLIYESIIKSLNNSKFRFFFETKLIICLKLKNDSFSILNGSQFVWNFNLTNKAQIIKQIVKQLKNGELSKDVVIEINSELYSQNICIPIPINNEIYVYVLVVKNLKAWFICQQYIYWHILPVLSKVAIVLRIEKELREDREEYIKTMKHKIYYLNNATLAMHFLRNKFSPIKNYLEMIERETTVDENKKEKYNNILQTEFKRVKTSTKDIIKRTTLILEKSENPFIVTELGILSFKKVLDICRNIWYDFFTNESISFEWKTFESVEKGYSLNEEGLEILVTDIIENLHQYNNGYYLLRFTEDEESFQIIFQNDIKKFAAKKAELEKLMNEFMSSDTIEINKRTTHGMSMIKSFLTQMKMVYSLSITNEIFLFTLSFKK